MEDVVVRPRYPRHNVRARRKRKYDRNTGNLPATILRQVLISLLIFLLLWGLKSINSPFTNIVLEKIRWVVANNTDIETVYKDIDNLVERAKALRGAKSAENNTEDDLPEDRHLPVSGSVSYQGTVNGTSEVNEKPDQDNETYSKNVKFSGSIILPVEGVLSSPYGERVDPFTNEIKLHRGIDIEAESGSPIKAAADGEIVEVGVVRTYGKYVKINHGDKVETVYAHCSEFMVEKGQIVNQGDIIAKVGNTGVSTGAHIHFELLKDGNSLNPQDYLEIPV